MHDKKFNWENITYTITYTDPTPSPWIPTIQESQANKELHKREMDAWITAEEWINKAKG
jgi:hypothetical protein